MVQRKKDGKHPGKCIHLEACDELKVEKQNFLARTSHALDIITTISAKSEFVVPLYSHEVLCDQKYCYSYIEDDLLYQSDDHLTPMGGQLLIRKLFTAPILNKMLDRQ